MVQIKSTQPTASADFSREEPGPIAKRYGIAATAFAEFVWLLREAGIEWEFVRRPVVREERVMIDVQIEAGDRVRVGSSTLYFDRDVIRVSDH